MIVIVITIIGTVNMRIGIVTKWLDEPYTGIGQYTYKLIKALLTIDKENGYTFIHKKGGKSDIYEHGQEMFLPRLGAGPMWIFPANFFLSIRRNRLDVVHEPYLGLLLPSDFKQVMTVHDITPILFGTSHQSFTMYFKTFMKKAVKRADAIITVSENTKRDIIEHFKADEEKVHMIHNGVDIVPADINRLGRLKKRFGLEGPFLLTVGSLLPTKNLATAVEAFAKALDKGKVDHKLVLAGKKDQDYRRLKDMVKKRGISKRVVFTDYLDWADVLCLYYSADVLLFPSLYEGFGFPPLEAMGYSTAVIASNTSSIPEVVGDAGILLDPNDTDAWAEAILKVTSDEGLHKELVAKGQKRVQMFTWEKAAKRTLKVYEGVHR
jgi:glycosyltransferase involved in cell wall biosynthesis